MQPKHNIFLENNPKSAGPVGAFCGAMLGETYLSGREVPGLLIHTSGRALSFLAQLRRVPVSCGFVKVRGVVVAY